MKITTNDIPYLGCDLSKLESANPEFDNDELLKYFNYMIERNNIYIRKEILKQPYPWTDNEIMRDNSFTCCKRYLDRTSKWLVDHISNNLELSYSDRVWRSILFRLYNKIETAELIELDSIDFWNRIPEMMDRVDSYPNDPFTRAYKVIRPKYAYRDKSPKGHEFWKSSLLWYISDLRLKYKGEVPHFLCETNASDATIWIKKNLDGVGDFIAYQVWVDLTYIDEYPMTDNEFVISGPGCHAGLDFLFSNRDGLDDVSLLFWWRDNIDRVFKSIDPGYDINKMFYYLPEDKRNWTLQDLENSFCENSKRRYLEEGRHKRPRKYILKEEGSK